VTGRRLWSNATDSACLTRPGPSAWHHCSHCGTRYRFIGKWVRLTTQPCPGCRLRREGRRMTYSTSECDSPWQPAADRRKLNGTTPGATPAPPLTTPGVREAPRHG
jgi:hypothetical protein